MPCFATTAPKIISIHALREEGDWFSEGDGL